MLPRSVNLIRKERSEKTRPTWVRSHLRWGEVSDLTRVEVRSHLDEMNSFSYKRFVFINWNSSFCWKLTQVRYPTWKGCLTSYKKPLIVQTERLPHKILWWHNHPWGVPSFQLLSLYFIIPLPNLVTPFSNVPWFVYAQRKSKQPNIKA